MIVNVRPLIIDSFLVGCVTKDFVQTCSIVNQNNCGLFYSGPQSNMNGFLVVLCSMLDYNSFFTLSSYQRFTVNRFKEKFIFVICANIKLKRGRLEGVNGPHELDTALAVTEVI